MKLSKLLFTIFFRLFNLFSQLLYNCISKSKNDLVLKLLFKAYAAYNFLNLYSKTLVKLFFISIKLYKSEKLFDFETTGYKRIFQRKHY